MADENLSFAQLVPVNARAKSWLADAVTRAQDENNELQLRFYADEQLNLRAQISDTPEAPASSRPERTASPVDPQTAFAELSLDGSRLPKHPPVGWRVGKESQFVDICIATAGAVRTPLHFLLYIHVESGVLMLQAGSSENNRLQVANDAQEWTSLAPSRAVALPKPINPIRLAGCEFQLRFHNKKLHEASGIIPSTGLVNSCRSYVLGGKSLGSGTFGDVQYAVHEITGDPVALKDVRIWNSNVRVEVCNEIAIHEDLNDSDYFLRLIECWCAEHTKHPLKCPNMGVEHFLLATQLALYDFRHPTFIQKFPYAKALVFYRQTLLGLQALEKRGIMHRDVTRHNMFVVKLDPPQAVIGDFGKAVRCLKHTYTKIGPRSKCAPEVVNSKPYDNRIDMWSWAYAAAEHLGYVPSVYEGITEQRLTEIHQYLAHVAVAQPDTADFVDLISGILVWKVDDRIQLSEALEHKVWANISDSNQEELDRLKNFSKRPNNRQGSEPPKTSLKRQKRKAGKEGSENGSTSTEPISEAP